MPDDDGIVHIGCYTADSGGRGTGIVAARRDPDTGALDVLGTVAVTPSPSFLTRHPTLPVLYAVNELPDGAVSAWRREPEGRLTPLGSAPTGGEAPCHLAVVAGGHLVAANYGSGSVSTHPLDATGAPGARTDLLRHDGHGPVADRQEQAHAHMVSPEPSGHRLLAVDLGSDAIHRYELDTVTGRLVPYAPVLRTRAGTGPRHLARHPDGRWLYVCGELDATVTAYHRDPDGGLREVARVPASERTGHVQPSEIAVRPDGRFLYLANRGVGTLTVYALDDGAPRYLTEVATGGQWPRHFALLGEHLYVADERAHQVGVFRVDADSGVPEPSAEPATVASPTCVRG